ncbi:uncharacterized protein LOC114723639 isoform X2 [Neltuma alba]|uniref:uncharacterized protein LOC114723639 isoform X2 n=1 Tax=Neltuma alba TaxID=207710 RepID=UPI0010A2DFFE|nr:uncharacterized protein LOC114723639 isoform X2 [Prosopis alba]
MEVNNRDKAGGGQTQDAFPNRNPSSPQTRGFKGKSCKGCLYYSSVQKSKSKNPTCVGFSRTLQQVPSSVVGETELEATKKGRNLTDFKYACVGHSVYIDNKSSSADPQDKTAILPFCLGLEVLLDKAPSSAAAGHVQAPAQKNDEHGNAQPQPQPQLQPRRYKPPSPTKEEYFNRFLRNADLVASGVVRNLYRVGSYVKDTVDDILSPYRRGPK